MLGAGPGRAQAQAPGTITGTVTDAATGDPLVDVNVVVTGSLYGAATDADGRYEIAGLPPDTYTLQVSTLGYRTARQTVEVRGGETATVPFRLTPASGSAGGGVDAPALPAPDSVDARVLRGSSDADLGAVLQAVAGVAVTRRGALGHGVSIRGLYGGQVYAAVDGLPLAGPSPLQATAPLLTVDPSTVKHVRVVRGPYALAQGPGALSAIRVQTRPPGGSADGIGFVRGQFQTDARAAETTGALHGSALGTDYHLQGVYRTGQPYSAGRGQTISAGYESGALQGNFRRALSERSTLQVSGAFTGQRDVGYPGRAVDTEALDAGRGHLQYDWQRAKGVLRKISVDAYAAQVLQEMSNANRLEPPFGGDFERQLSIRLRSEVQTWGSRAAMQMQPHSRLQLDVGADFHHTYRTARRVQRFLADGGTIGLPSIFDDAGWPEVKTTNLGAFVRAEQTLGPVRTVATIRLDREDLQPGIPEGIPPTVNLLIENTETTTWSAALQGALPLSQRWTLGLGGGSVARTPLPEERYANGLSTSAVLDQRRVEQPTGAAASALQPERSWQADLWLTADTERLDAAFTAFARRISDYITIEAVPRVSPSLWGPRYVYTNARASFFGGEVAGQYHVNPLLRVEAQGQYAWGEEEGDRPAPRVAPLSGRLGLRAEAPFDEALFLDVTLKGAARHSRNATLRGESATDGYVTTDVQLGLAPAAGASLIVGVHNLTDATVARPLNAQRASNGVLREPGRAFTFDLRVRF